ncbi:MAG: dihydropteroate synthase [Solirubrobacterales bacterium]|nr:dihydropteroate synthase [Solirubrobacterales bacterium]
MAIHNASPDSFSGHGGEDWLGAAIVDVGGESARTDKPAVGVEEEVERVVPVIAALSAHGATVSVDTYKPAVAAAAIGAGAAIVNDISALADPELADVCADTGAGLILMHNRARPKQKLLDPRYDGQIVEDIHAQLGQLIEVALDRGVSEQQLMLDPGPDFGKTPHQTVEAMRAFETLHSFGRPLLAAISRKDFIGVATRRPPQDRDPGTLAALGYVADAGVHVARVHDLEGAKDYLAVRGLLAGEETLGSEDRLAEHLRRRR